MLLEPKHICESSLADRRANNGSKVPALIAESLGGFTPHQVKGVVSQTRVDFEADDS